MKKHNFKNPGNSEYFVVVGEDKFKLYINGILKLNYEHAFAYFFFWYLVNIESTKNRLVYKFTLSKLLNVNLFSSFCQRKKKLIFKNYKNVKILDMLQWKLKKIFKLFMFLSILVIIMYYA